MYWGTNRIRWISSVLRSKYSGCYVFIVIWKATEITGFISSSRAWSYLCLWKPNCIFKWGFFFLMLKERCNAAWLTNCQRRTNEMLLDRKGMKRCYKLYWDGNNSKKGNNYMMLCEHRNCIIWLGFTTWRKIRDLDNN